MKTSLKKNFSRGARNYEAIAKPQMEAAKQLVELASPFIKNNSQLLDLGSGTSFIAKEICRKFADKNLKITEVDISQDMLNCWLQRPKNVSTICADIENLELPNNNFDIIFSSFALHWLTNFDKNFAEFSKLLKKDGYFIFALPSANSLVELKNENFPVNDFPSNSELKTALKNCGFKEINFTQSHHHQDFPNIMSAVKFIKKIGGNSKKTASNTAWRDLRNFHLKNSKSAKSFTISWNLSFFIYQI